jgi:hypothetical protein
MASTNIEDSVNRVTKDMKVATEKEENDQQKEENEPNELPAGAKKEGNATESNERKRPGEDARDDNADSKRARSEEVVDKAVELGFKAGDRLEVEWEVGEDNDKKTRYWGATLLEHDGRTKEGFAIRVIDYDPYPEGGFPERSKEDVVFIAQYLMIDPETGDQLHFRREGADAIVDFREEDLNEMLAKTLSKKSEAWNKLSAAQQAQVADMISTGKERLLDAIKSRWEQHPGKVITAEEVPDILEQAFQGM